VLGLSVQNSWLAVLLVFSAAIFIATARGARLFTRDRSLMAYSIGFSVAFTALAIAAGLSFLR
jgi:hydrogenase/urease accessory protein HupE